MKYSMEIIKIIEGAVKLDKIKVINYVNLLEEKLIEDNDNRTASRIKRIIEQNVKDNKITNSSLKYFNNTPVDQESRLSMADFVDYRDIKDDIVLNNNEEKNVNKFIESYVLKDKFIESGVELRNTMLLYGPPGCGKTKLAYHLAKQIRLPLVIARLDSLISSYLGNTAKNIRILFEYVQQTPCILFLDEFDAIAKARDDAHEMGELKRVVNSLLQNIDMINKDSVLVAATNHEHILDSAVWRRFQYKIKMEKPNQDSRIKLIKNYLKNSVLSEDEIFKIAKAFNGLSGAEVEEICLKSLADMIIKDKNLTITLIAHNFFDFKNIYQLNQDDNLSEAQQVRAWNSAKAKFLRNMDNKFFSYSIIAEILNISKSSVSNFLKEGD